MSFQMQDTQTRIPGRNRAVMRGWLTTASEIENFPIPPGSRLQTRDVSSLSNWVIMSSHPKRPRVSEVDVERRCPISAAWSIAGSPPNYAPFPYVFHHRLRWIPVEPDSQSMIDGH